METGADQLRDWLTRRGFNQREAADYLGLEQSFMSLMINGLRSPGLTLAVRIHERTGIPVAAWLLEREQNANPVDAEAAKPQADHGDICEG